MLSPRMCRIGRRIVFVNHNVRHQADPAMNPLKQIMAQQRIFGHAAGKAALERVHVVDAFTDIAAAAEEVLIDVGDGVAIEIKADVAGKNAREGSGVDAGGRDLGARLEQSVASHNLARSRVASRLIERVRQRADQAARAFAAQDGVGVQGDHILNLTQQVSRGIDCHQ